MDLFRCRGGNKSYRDNLCNFCFVLIILQLFQERLTNSPGCFGMGTATEPYQKHPLDRPRPFSNITHRLL
jgi:hypothetical protein